ncbi:hypothetical protein [Sphingomicrobium sediminis]|uniref:Lipoprotein n=1 Tax=Sphingomicrobium sediminis TaxID=2950949 RepID=A0A9X2J3B2_9SPHN|nr:hypothetical protein [Sphingomicrobium sediminis]MCM8557111.1 hypothetical protein [Sphingomicrobium sediminis]
MLRPLAIAAATLTLAACGGQGTIRDGGVIAARSVCPQLAIPAGTGSVTLFDPAGSTASSAIDVTATITNLDGSCFEDSSSVVSTATFDVIASRREAGPARSLTLPIFNVAVQGGDAVVAKRIGQVTLNFAAGSLSAEAPGQATIRVNRSATQLPPEIERELTRRRDPGDVDAAIDPLSQPAVRAAVARATFEQLVGFQLSGDQLRYNVTR